MHCCQEQKKEPYGFVKVYFLNKNSSMMVRSAMVQTPNTIQASLWSSGSFSQAWGTYVVQNKITAFNGRYVFFMDTLMVWSVWGFVTASRICIGENEHITCVFHVFLDEGTKIDGFWYVIFLCLFFEVRRNF